MKLTLVPISFPMYGHLRVYHTVAKRLFFLKKDAEPTERRKRDCV